VFGIYPTITGIYFTKQIFIFVFVENVMNKLVGSNPTVMYLRETCGQRSSIAAGSKLRVLAFYFLMQFCCMLSISKCREESHPGLCSFLGLAKAMQLRDGDFEFKKAFGPKIR